MLISLGSLELFYITKRACIIDLLLVTDFYIQKINSSVLVLISRIIKHIIYISTRKDFNSYAFTEFI